MRVCEEHGDPVVVYNKSCPLCEALKEIEAHERDNSELTEKLKTKEKEIEELQEELANIKEQIKSQEA